MKKDKGRKKIILSIQSAIDIAVHHISLQCSEGQRLRGILNVCKVQPVQAPNFS